MMTVDGIHHVAIGVTDLERARRFYADGLALEEIPRPAFDFDGAWFRAGPQQIHLIVRPEVAPRGGTLETRGAHLALRVRSYRETLDHLRALGIPSLDRPRNKTPWPQIYVSDPDGNVIELSADRLD